MTFNIADLIKNAKIGRERKDAQIDTCGPFGAALYDVLVEYDFDVNLVVAGYRGVTTERTWYHLVIEHDGTYYDSLGEFSTEIMRQRLKIHPRSEYALSFKPEPRLGCYEEEDYELLYDFLVAEFRKAARKLEAASVSAPAAPRMRTAKTSELFDAQIAANIDHNDLLEDTMTLATFDDYYDFYAPKMEKYPQQEDFMKVLDWVADKPGNVSSFGDLALVIDPDKDPTSHEMMSRVMAITVILTGWEHQIADPFFRVKSSNGELYEVKTVEQAVLEGKKAYFLDETGETIENFPSRAYMHVRFKNFEPRVQPTLAAGSVPRL
jgi:hypothetical protein